MSSPRKIACGREFEINDERRDSLTPILLNSFLRQGRADCRALARAEGKDPVDVDRLLQLRPEERDEPFEMAASMAGTTASAFSSSLSSSSSSGYFRDGGSSESLADAFWSLSVGAGTAVRWSGV